MFYQRQNGAATKPEPTIHQTQPHSEPELSPSEALLQQEETVESPPANSAENPAPTPPSRRRQRNQEREPVIAQEVSRDDGNEFLLTQRLVGLVGLGAIVQMIGVNSGAVVLLGWLPNGIGVIALLCIGLGQKAKRWSLRNVGIELLITLMVIGLVSAISTASKGVVQGLSPTSTPTSESKTSP